MELDPGPSDWWRRFRIPRQEREYARGQGQGRPEGVQRLGEGRSSTHQSLENEDDASPANRGVRIGNRDVARKYLHGRDNEGKRQATTTTANAPPSTATTGATSSSQTASGTSTPAAAPSPTSSPLFVPPPSTFSTTTTTATQSGASLTSSPSPSFTRSSASGSSRSFTSLWSTTRVSSAAASPTFIPGVTFNLTLAGTRDDEAIYAVEVDIGHGSGGVSNAYAWWDDNMDREQDRLEDGAESGQGASARSSRTIRRGGRLRRQSGSLGLGYQRVKLQVDLGSSDMWVATINCTSSDCRSAPARFDGSDSISSGLRANMTYHSGSVSGPILWDEVQLGKFAIAYQAFIGGDRVTDENLGGGDFSGVLGMALPANSVISVQIPGTTSSNPDGATFLDNLFGSGTYAPSQRIFSLALERREDVRTTSVLTIGSVYDKYCPAPCVPPWIPIIANPRLGPIGYLHWRVPLLGVTATTWSDPQRGTGPTQQNIPLGPSVVVSTRSQPLAVLDSGGVAVLVASKAYADAIYGAYDIKSSSDGYYRMPCKTQLALSFNFGGTWFAAHPLDMSWPDPTDPSQTTCIGAIQYASSLVTSEAGDFVFGSSFLKNVYTVFSYPDQARNGLWQPQVGLIGLTNASLASEDFYAVRTLRQSLASVSSQGPFIGDSSSPSSPSSTPSATSGGGSVVNTTAIVAGSVVGFFVLAAFAFCAWWFFLKRKYGAAGYPSRKRANGEPGTPESESAAKLAVLGGLAGRSKKHQEVYRQKSMIEGYSDYEGDSWTEGADSLALGYMPEVAEDGGRMEGARGRREGSAGSSLRTSRLVTAVTAAELEKEVGEGADVDGRTPIQGGGQGIQPTSTRSRSIGRSSSRPRHPDLPRPTFAGMPSNDDVSPTLYDITVPPIPASLSQNSQATASGPVPLPRGRPRDTARTMSISMSGPFPSTTANGMAGRHRQSEIETSPMYEIRSSDYFDIGDAGPRRGSAGRGGSWSRERSSERRGS